MGGDRQLTNESVIYTGVCIFGDQGAGEGESGEEVPLPQGGVGR